MKPKQIHISKMSTLILAIPLSLTLSSCGVTSDPETLDLSNSQLNSSEQAKGGASSNKEKIGKTGESLTVGDSVVTIHSYNDKKTKYASDNQFIDPVTTSGKFVEVSLTLQNKGKEEKMYSASDFILIDEEGREFAASDDFNIMMIADSKLFLEGVNPGMSIKAKLIFEVPKEVTSYTIKYTDFTSEGKIKIK